MKSKLKKIHIFFLAALLLSQPVLVLPGNGGYPSVNGPCGLEFPRDHASHPDFRIEWWYYTGNLESEEGERFGFQLTFFRIRTIPEESEKQWPQDRSAWRSGQVIAAHAAVTEISSGSFHAAEKMSRAALGLAGASEPQPGAGADGNGGFEVFIGDWRARITPGAHALSACVPEFSFQLELLPEKPPVLHGDAGYSRKGEGPGEASCYYSITRLKASGKLSVGGREKTVSGHAWMDHEFSSASLNPLLAGWDWFSLRLSDGSDLMLYRLRLKDGGVSPVSSGTYVDPEGKAVHLSSNDISVSARDSWKSPHNGAIYPSSWLLEVAPAGLRLDVIPNVADQEVHSKESTRVTYWEGSVSAKGTMRGEAVFAEGYIELTGYAGAVDY